MSNHRETMAGTTVQGEMGEGQGDRGGSDNRGQNPPGREEDPQGRGLGPLGLGTSGHLDGHRGGSSSATL